MTDHIINDNHRKLDAVENIFNEIRSATNYYDYNSI